MSQTVGMLSVAILVMAAAVIGLAARVMAW